MSNSRLGFSHLKNAGIKKLLWIVMQQHIRMKNLKLRGNLKEKKLERHSGEIQKWRKVNAQVVIHLMNEKGREKIFFFFRESVERGKVFHENIKTGKKKRSLA